MKKIGDDKLKEICKIGQGAECCRYITAGAEGICCAKNTNLQYTLDSRVDKMTA